MNIDEMLLTDEEIQGAKMGHVAIYVKGKPEVREADYFVAKAQHEKDMSYVIQKGGVCPECDGSRMSNPDDCDQDYEACERCTMLKVQRHRRTP